MSMHYEYIGALEVTYGNALAAGGGFHRVTTAEGAAAEITPSTFLWYKKLTAGTGSAPTSGGGSDNGSASPTSTRGIVQLRIGREELDEQEAEAETAWTKLDKSIDRQKGVFLWYQSAKVEELSTSSVTSRPMPLKEIRVVRDLKDIPDGFESLEQPILSADSSGKELRTYLCFRRLGSEDFSGSKWSILSQKAGNWIDVKDLSSNKWSVAQITHHTAAEIRVHIPTWRKGRDEFLSRATCRNRVAKLATHTNLYMSPAYPFPRKQGSTWSVGMKELQTAREQFDQFFYDRSKQTTYLPRHLIPFIEKSLLCAFVSSELAEEMNAFHQHVLKNIVACMLGNDADHVMLHMLSLLRMILNGHSSCMYFYLKYPGSYSAVKYQRLVYTSYLASPEALATIPTRHPCRSFYFIDNVDLFVQAGGFRVILQRLARTDIALTEVVLYCSLLNQAKPCLAQQKRRRSSSSSRRRSTTDTQVEDFFRDFLNATFARLRRMSGEELKDDDGVIDQIVGILDVLCRDGVLLGGNGLEPDLDESTSSEGSFSSCDVEFAEAIEIFHLDLSKKFICCPYLGQRLLGISRLNDLIAMAHRKDTLQRKASLIMRRSSSSSVSTTTSLSASAVQSSRASASGSQPVTKWLRSRYLVEWLTASDILEVILGDRESCTKYNLQEGTHLEILKRSKKIFEFVAAHGLLTEKHIVLLWKTALSQLHSGRKTVFDILISLCGVLSADLMDVVVMLLTQVPLGDYDELIVHFIKRVIAIASKLVVESETAGSKMSLTSLVSAAAGTKSHSKLSPSAQKDVEVLNKVVNLGCTLFWNAILQSDALPVGDASAGTGLRGSVRAEVETALADSLNRIQKLWLSAGASSTASGKEQQQLLNDYLQKCAENIKTGTLVETSMSLIQRIVDGYGHGGGSSSLSSSTLSLSRASSQPATSSSELLKELNSEHSIVAVVVEEIKNYMARSSSEDTTPSSHLAAIQKRLSFLGYLVTKSDLKLSFASMEQLWSCFDGSSNSVEEREIFFSWFTSVVPDPNNFVHRAYSGHTAFSEVVTGEIFHALINSEVSASTAAASGIHLDMRTMGKEAFWALERLFRFVNTSSRRLSCGSALVGSSAPRSGTGSSRGGSVLPRSASVGASDSEDDGELFVVEAMDLKGLETLYDVALRAENDVVSQQAINYLIYLELHVGSKLVRREVWADFVSGCLGRLRDKMQGAVDATSTREVLRLLVLLNTFLHQSVVQAHDGAGVGSTFDGPEELTVYVRTQDGRVAAPFWYNLRRTSLVSELRDRIAKDTGHPADRVRIVNSFKTKLTAQGHGKFTLEKARVFTAPSSHAVHLSTTRRSSAQTTPTTSRRGSKQGNYVEAVLLSKVESDTSGHTNRPIMDFHGASVGAASVGGGGAGNNSTASDWHAIKTEISSNGSWVGLLFDLLTYRDGIAEEVWKILKLLDSDPAMEKQMRTLNNVLAIDGSIRKTPASFEWDILLDPACPPKLLYQLELVETFALCGDACRPNDDDDDSSDDYGGNDSTNDTDGVDGLIGTVNTWSESFLKLGGRAQLEKFVLSSSPRQLIAQGTLSVMCLSKLLKLLRHFVLVESKLAEKEGGALEGDPQDLIHQLLETLSNLQSIAEASQEATVSQVTSQRSAISQHKVSLSKEERATSPLPLLLTTYTRPQVEDPDNTGGIPSDAYLMTRLLSCVASCALVAEQDALPLLESYLTHGQIFLRCLVENRFKPVRQEAADAIAALGTVKNKHLDDRIVCCNFYLRLLGEYEGPVSDEEYYNVFTLLVSSAENLTDFAILPSCRTLCRRIKSFETKDEATSVAPASSMSFSNRSITGGSKRWTSSMPLSSKKAAAPAPAPDVLLQGQLSTLLAIVKRIPAVLADGLLDVPCDGRTLREVVSSTLHEKEGIMDELFHQCLFATPDHKRNKDLPTSGGSGTAPQMDTTITQVSSSSQYYLQQPKCRSDSCRAVAFDLLAELSVDNTAGLQYLLVQMAGQHSLERPPEPTGATSLTASASKRKNVKTSKDQLLQRGKYVGLKNLGCTCYLNSTVQSFFMMPQFRRQVLRLPVNTSDSSGDGAEVTSLTYELQSLFAHLEGSAKPYYNPRPFTRAMKTWDGESVDVNVQQDASEFLTSFFQQIESEMNGINLGDENLLNTFFGGEFSNELVAEGDRYSERFEPFHFISVPVRDRKNLKESLDGWVEGDKVSYTWEKGSGSGSKEEGSGSGDDGAAGDTETEKVTLETHKRISISKLPGYLIIHLKRFEFDFEKMQQIKLHDRFEFPMELDMYPYTKEGQEEKRKREAAEESTNVHEPRLSIPDGSQSESAGDSRTTAPEYSQYELVGSVVHLGTAHSGHYYSFLREQQAQSDKNQWYEFNDTLVTPFDPEQIPEECFGGEEETGRVRCSSTLSSSGGGSTQPAKMKNRSSFMLFYARIQPELRVVSDENTPCISFSISVLVAAFCARLKRRASSRLAHLRSVVQVIAPEPIRQLIAMENRLFWRKKYLYDSRCLKFTFDLLSSCLVGAENAKSMGVLPTFEPVEVQLEALQMATKFVFGTLWQGGDVSKVLEWHLMLQVLYHSDVGGSRWFLATMAKNESLLLDLLVFNEHREVREVMASVLSEAMATTSNVEFEEVGNSAATDDTERTSGPEGSSKLPPSFEFMFLLLQLMPALLSVPVDHHRQYFLTMYDFVQTGRNEGSFLAVNSVVGAIVALLTGLGNTQPLLQPQLKVHKPKQILKRIDLSATVLKLLSVLIRCGLPPAMDVQADEKHPIVLPPNMAHDHVDLTPADHDVLLSERFITLLTQRANHYTKETKPLEQIVNHLCWESRRATTAFMDKIMQGIELEDHHDVKPYFRTLNSLLKIRDSLAAERLNDGLTKLLAVLASQQRFYKATETSIDMLARLAKRHGGVTRWLRENRMSCLWMEKWLVAHRGAEGYLQQRKTVLVKPNSTSTWVNVSVTSSGLIKSIDRSITKLLPRIRSILDPEASVETFYDSDDNPQRLVGKRVRVKWAKDKWYEGTVQHFNEDTYEHFVSYDDGDKRSYHMSEKLFYVVDLTPSPKTRTKHHKHVHK